MEFKRCPFDNVNIEIMSNIILFSKFFIPEREWSLTYINIITVSI